MAAGRRVGLERLAAEELAQMILHTSQTAQAAELLVHNNWSPLSNQRTAAELGW